MFKFKSQTFSEAIFHVGLMAAWEYGRRLANLKLAIETPSLNQQYRDKCAKDFESLRGEFISEIEMIFKGDTLNQNLIFQHLDYAIEHEQKKNSWGQNA